MRCLEVKALGQKKALIVTDAVLVKVGAAKALTDVLDDAGIGYAIYDGCLPNPTVAQVDAGAARRAVRGVLEPKRWISTRNPLEFPRFSSTFPCFFLDVPLFEVKMLKENGCDFVVSFGGGSPHDCAKAISMLCANGGSIKDYEGVDKSTKPMLPLAARPFSP